MSRFNESLSGVGELDWSVTVDKSDVGVAKYIYFLSPAIVSIFYLVVGLCCATSFLCHRSVTCLIPGLYCRRRCSVQHSHFSRSCVNYTCLATVPSVVSCFIVIRMIRRIKLVECRQSHLSLSWCLVEEVCRALFVRQSRERQTVKLSHSLRHVVSWPQDFTLHQPLARNLMLHLLPVFDEV